MPQTLSPAEAAARVEASDSIGIPLGTGQPGAFFEALGERDDWDELRIYGALRWSSVAWASSARVSCGLTLSISPPRS